MMKETIGNILAAFYYGGLLIAFAVKVTFNIIFRRK